MGFELPDGKTARNLQEQVKFLSEKLKDLIAFVNQAGLKKIQIVEELPEVGDPTVLYLLAKEDPDTGDYYDEYLWIDNAWELIGSTQIDLSDYVTLSTDQTITGEKTFNDKIKFNNSSRTAEVGLDGSSGLYIRDASSGAGIRADYISGSGPAVKSYGFNTSLGTPSYAWKDLYLSGTAHIGSQSLQDTGGGANLLLTAVSHIIENATVVRPFTTNTTDLGSSSYQWKDLYLSNSIKLGANANATVNTWGTVIFSNGSTGLYTFDTVLETKTLRPALDNTYDLGGSTRYWRDLYLSGSAYIPEIKDANGTSRLSISSAGIVTLNGNMYPQANNASLLGYSARVFNTVYTTNLSDGTNSVTVAQLASLSGAHLYKHTIACDNDVITIINGSSTPINTVTDILAAFPNAVRFLFYYDTFGNTQNVILADDVNETLMIANSVPQLTWVSIDNYNTIVDTVSAYN